jgi:hypothetical protein
MCKPFTIKNCIFFFPLSEHSHCIRNLTSCRPCNLFHWVISQDIIKAQLGSPPYRITLRNMYPSPNIIGFGCFQTENPLRVLHYAERCFIEVQRQGSLPEVLSRSGERSSATPRPARSWELCAKLQLSHHMRAVGYMPFCSVFTLSVLLKCQMKVRWKVWS